MGTILARVQEEATERESESVDREKGFRKKRKKKERRKRKKGFEKSRFWDENNFTVGEWQALDDKAAKKGIIIICMLSVLNIRKKRKEMCVKKREILTQK